MSAKKKKWLIFFAFFHLGLITFSSTKGSLGSIFGLNAVIEAVSVYSYVSGAGYHYGFFAPGVFSQLKIDYRCLKDSKEIKKGELGSSNIEVTFRVHNIIEHFWETDKEIKEKRSMAASFASKVFQYCPEATQAEVSVSAHVLPSMAETRKGAKPYWENYYKGTFER